MLQLPSLPLTAFIKAVQKFPAAADSSNLHWNTGKEGGLLWTLTWMSLSMRTTLPQRCPRYSSHFIQHCKQCLWFLVAFTGTFYIVIEQVGHFLNLMLFFFPAKEASNYGNITNHRGTVIQAWNSGKRCALITCVCFNVCLFFIANFHIYLFYKSEA